MIHPQSSPKSIAERIAREVWMIQTDGGLPSWHGATHAARSDVLAGVDIVLDAIHAAGLAVVEAEDSR
jgi:hypothetical protein